MRNIIITLTLLLFVLSCNKEQNEPLIIDRKLDSLDLKTTHGNYTYIQAWQDKLVKRKAYSAEVQGWFIRILPTDTVVRYGHVWSDQSTLPEIDAHDYSEVKGLQQSGIVTNLKFVTRLAGLDSKTTYWVRSYIVTTKDTVYNRSVLVMQTIQPDNVWEDVNAQFYGIKREGAFCFVIGDKAYVGTGNNDFTYYNDLYAFSGESGVWSYCANLPSKAKARSKAFAFASEGKGYVGTGYDGLDWLDDFYGYDPVTNTWTEKFQREAYPSKIANAVAFGVGKTGYVGFGEYGKNSKKAFYEYDLQRDLHPTISAWQQTNLFPGVAREGAVAFVIKVRSINRAFIACGKSYDIETKKYTYLKDMWMYDPENGSWSQRAEIPGAGRSGAFAFSIDDEGYIGTGETEVGGSYSLLSDFYMYDPYDNKWTQKASFLGGGLRNGVGFSVNTNYGYGGTGYKNDGFTEEIYRYSPYSDEAAENGDDFAKE